MAKEVLQETVAHMKMELTYKMSLISLKIHSGMYSETIQGKVSPITWCAQSYRRTNRGAPPAV